MQREQHVVVLALTQGDSHSVQFSMLERKHSTHPDASPKRLIQSGHALAERQNHRLLEEAGVEQDTSHALLFLGRDPFLKYDLVGSDLRTGTVNRLQPGLVPLHQAPQLGSCSEGERPIQIFMQGPLDQFGSDRSVEFGMALHKATQEGKDARQLLPNRRLSRPSQFIPVALKPLP